YDETRFISPQSPNCQDYFSYLAHDGSIVPKHGLKPDEKDKAHYTIDLLNLNASFLKAERARHLTEIINEIDKLMDDDIDYEGTVEAIRDLAQCELTLTDRQHPDIEQSALPQLRAFHTATLSRFGTIGVEIIKQHCREIL
ncbi:MAG: hypothetical protein MJK04_26840, partial [Psychrosphaera sp.]|nr:hypothetical protein [Psychrosphaera sp.]